MNKYIYIYIYILSLAPNAGVNHSGSSCAWQTKKTTGPRMAFLFFPAVAHGFVFGLDGESLKRTSFPVHIFVVRRGVAGGVFWEARWVYE